MSSNAATIEDLKRRLMESWTLCDNDDDNNQDNAQTYLDMRNESMMSPSNSLYNTSQNISHINLSTSNTHQSPHDQNNNNNLNNNLSNNLNNNLNNNYDENENRRSTSLKSPNRLIGSPSSGNYILSIISIKFYSLSLIIIGTFIIAY